VKIEEPFKEPELDPEEKMRAAVEK